MENVKLSPEDIATVISFIVPGYFAVLAYCSVHTKSDKGFPKILIESIAYSLPLVGFYNVLWTKLSQREISTTSIRYFLPLLAGSLALGYLLGKIRGLKWTRRTIRWLGLPGPSDDFMQAQFNKLGPSDIVTVTLKNSEVFSGVRAGISPYKKAEVQMCYFNYIAWFKKDTNTWDLRPGSLIIRFDDILYIETPSVLSQD